MIGLIILLTGALVCAVMLPTACTPCHDRRCPVSDPFLEQRERGQPAATQPAPTALADAERGQSPTRKVLSVLRVLETGSDPTPRLATAYSRDGGPKAIGPYQITAAFWDDADMGMPWAMARDSATAELAIVRYWTRHCPDAIANGDAETLMATFHHGPRGADRPRSDYVQRGLNLLEAGVR